MELDMNNSESIYKQSGEGRQDLEKADFLNRIIAKAIDLIIVIALCEIIPKIGYLAGISYLLMADGLFDGRSIGKRLIGLKVIIRDRAGSTAVCGFKESVLRNLPFAAGYILFGILNAIPLIGWIISFAIIAAIIIFESLVMLGNEDGMRLGDEIAKTQVVEENRGD
ncbi:MAG TPA: hypothetical protein ENH01_12115 [Nitrospirae bacterium]|nr:hypothetical protein [Nitrospirota bacterium]